MARVPGERGMNGRYRALFDFGGKTVIVTGAASGLGREISLALADFGADVVIADKNAPGLRKVAAELEPAAASVLPCPTDVSVPEQVDALVSAALGVSGRIDALIHCAGIGGRSPAVSYPMELWDEVISVKRRRDLSLHPGGWTGDAGAGKRRRHRQSFIDRGYGGQAGQRRLPGEQGHGNTDRQRAWEWSGGRTACGSIPSRPGCS